jgi:hypothetical protein
VRLRLQEAHARRKLREDVDLLESPGREQLYIRHVKPCIY